VRPWALLLLAVVPLAAGAAPGTDPFYSSNRGPLATTSGVPGRESARLPGQGTLDIDLLIDAASNATDTDYEREQIVLDGETVRTNLRLRYGAGTRLELGADLVWLRHGGGMFDGFIRNWHHFFGLPGGDRAHQPEGRLLFEYWRDNRRLLYLHEPVSGFGDASLSAAWQLRDTGNAALALRGGVELPTGDADRLLGSGSTDVHLELVSSRALERPKRTLTVHTGAGVLSRSSADLLAGRQNAWVGHGFAALAWPVSNAIHLKAQVNAHTSLYDSEVPELHSASVQLLLGGTAVIGEAFTFDVAVGEDLIGETPDVSLQLALRYRR